MGWRDMRIRYATTILGPFWTTLSVLLTTMALGGVYGTLFNLELKTYIPYVSTGLLVWNFFSNVLNEAPTLFTSSRSILLNTNFPLGIFSIQMVWKNMVVYLYSVPAVLFVNYFLGSIPGLVTIQSFVALILLSLTLVPLAHILGIIGAKLPDIAVFFPTIMLIVFLATPILWPISSLGNRTWIAEANPVYWVIAAVRQPLLNVSPDKNSWIVMIVLAVVTNLSSELIGRNQYSKVKLGL
jgi:ABC-type polysaccharide/polyol phosphate export permease